MAKDDPPQDSDRWNRRSFADEEKLAIVMETPGVSVAAVCRRHGIVTSMVFRWRVQSGFAQKRCAKLVPVAVTENGLTISSAPVVLRDPVATARRNDDRGIT